MTAPNKTVSDVTVYVEEYAEFIVQGGTAADEEGWNKLLGQLSSSQLYELSVTQEIRGGVQFFAQRPYEAMAQPVTFLVGDIDT